MNAIHVHIQPARLWVPLHWSGVSVKMYPDLAVVRLGWSRWRSVLVTWRRGR